jgi:hypothetical protein
MRVMERRAIDKQDVRHMDHASLANLGVHLVNAADLVLKCDSCGETWSPQLDAGGKLAFDYWICPAQCNEGTHQTGRVRSAGR